MTDDQATIDALEARVDELNDRLADTERERDDLAAKLDAARSALDTLADQADAINSDALTAAIAANR